jgi:hypothetical protein
MVSRFSCSRGPACGWHAAFARAVAFGACALGGVACVPELDDRVFLVTGPTLLGIAATPAEAAPSSSVTMSALYVDPNGDRSADPSTHLAWSFCVAREALTDQGTVSPGCLASGGPNLVGIGDGPSAKGVLPADTCRLFGPDPPDATNGQPAGRPVDPDPTGGFFQPVRLLLSDGGDTFAIGATRIACGVGGATGQVTSEFAAQYTMNQAPALASLSIVRATGKTIVAPDAPGAAPGGVVAPGEHVTLEAAWAPCATTATCSNGVCGKPVGCTGSEQYLVFDPVGRALEVQREAIRVAWFTTGGTLEDDTSGRAASEADTSTLDNPWTAPTTAGDVRIWLVIRDDRGGVGWQSYRVQVN